MDWARDNTGINEKDMDTVFKYEEKFTTIVRILEHDAKPLIWTLETENDWKDWFEEYPPIDDATPSGLILIKSSLARRSGEPSLGGLKKAKTDEWLERIERSLPGRTKPERAMTFPSMDEKAGDGGPPAAHIMAGGRQTLRRLPFSQPTFRLITDKFYTHGSIARAVSRADIPVFSSAEVRMGGYPAYVTNCRTTNAWNMDLGLTCTYFPHCGLTFAIAFGCSLAVEEEILKRLSFATHEAAHPLLMPGIVAELERSRHVHLVENTIDEIETKIFELDFKNSDMDGTGDEDDSERKNFEKRNSWLDTAYLRNQLISWNTQLAKMAAHADELEKVLYIKSTDNKAPRRRRRRRNSSRSQEDEDSRSDTSRRPRSEVDSLSIQRFREEVGFQGGRSRYLDDSRTPSRQQQGIEDSPAAGGKPSFSGDPEAFRENMRRAGGKIKDRIQAIVDEYDDKIRDCTMRVDGMAMATQWADGESNVQIALEMRRDSRHMRSIAVVTMVFLPGTFFASIFSMTFFNWSPGGSSDGPNNTSDEVVSSWLWIYVLFTVFATSATMLSWWYFVVYRHSKAWKLRKARNDGLLGEESIPLV
ncbi:hypothetical protein QBC37DRAFT_458744 [Rhypophila decipiens]|uniref:Uncharacterized protein n=1 Tax=Rhypophila decipiens TaxID=261697 RepID=A0AAN6YCI1_9PEZI|nr:hypothetical protein QBC37DRAFT_458744 [Rhypophila decipiens]